MPRSGPKQATGREQHAFIPEQCGAEIAAIGGEAQRRESDRPGLGGLPGKMFLILLKKSIERCQVAADDLQVAAQDFCALAQSQPRQELAGSGRADGGVVLQLG
jgi:hypothetical protein